jgi:hypothetical protein
MKATTMSENTVLDALDAMIASFGDDQTPANVQNKVEDLRHSQPILDDLAVGRSQKRDTYKELTGTESIPINSSRVIIPKINVQLPKRPKTTNSAALGLTDSSNFVQKRAECFWHLANGQRIVRNLCAGCRRPIMCDEESLGLADDNRIHFPHGDDAYDCLIRHGERWRQAARKAALMPADAQKSGPRPDRGEPRDGRHTSPQRILAMVFNGSAR